jgi:elongation factor P hydroxylase
VNDVVLIFNKLFELSENTILVTGAKEPLYLPATKEGGVSQVVSREDYFSSALHEISHWCIAGTQRRTLVDFGYWYEPDGRSEKQQRAFEDVEVKPQALEWIFTTACNLPFSLSVDNVNQPELVASPEFKRKVAEQACLYLNDSLPARANLFSQALLDFFRKDNPVLDKTAFSLSNLV